MFATHRCDSLHVRCLQHIEVIAYMLDVCNMADIFGILNVCNTWIFIA